MLNKISIVQKLILLLFFLSVQFIYATDLENPFIKNKGQLPQKVIAKVCLPGGALFIEKGISNLTGFLSAEIALSLV